MEVSLHASPAPTETAADARRPIADSFRHPENRTGRSRNPIKTGRWLPPLPETKRIEANRPHGCQAGIRPVVNHRDGTLYFEAKRGPAILAGLIALLLEVCSGRQADQVLVTSSAFVHGIRLTGHVSLHRADGLSPMLARIRTFAVAHVTGTLAGEGV